MLSTVESELKMASLKFRMDVLKDMMPVIERMIIMARTDLRKDRLRIQKTMRETEPNWELGTQLINRMNSRRHRIIRLSAYFHAVREAHCIRPVHRQIQMDGACLNCGALSCNWNGLQRMYNNVDLKNMIKAISKMLTFLNSLGMDSKEEYDLLVKHFNGTLPFQHTGKKWANQTEDSFPIEEATEEEYTI